MQRATIATITFAAAIFTSTMAHGQDDHGGTRATATAVAFPSDTAGTISPGNDEDYFRFTLSAAQTNLVVETVGGFDYQGWLYNSGGTQLATNDDGGEGDNFRITRNSIAAGTYYVRVASVNNETGNYRLRIFVNGSDIHGNVATAATSVTAPSDTSGTINSFTDEDYFSFTLSGAVDFVIETTGTTDTVGWLYDSGGNQLATNDDGGTRTNFRITQTTLSAGTYYVRVEGYSVSIGPYTLRLSGTVEAPPPPPPPNLAPETTGTIDAVSLDTGQSVAFSGRDYFNDPDGYTLNFSGSSSNPAVATVEASDYDTLTVAGVAEGLAEVTLSAADSGGLSASLSFMVTVGNPATLGGAGELSAFASAPEGGVVELTVSFAKPRDADVELAWAIGIDNDPATADADENDHGGAAGEVVIPAGETSATINIAIADDADIEPAREVFVVSLTPQEGLGFGVANATVHVEEGVCDRTPQLADELRGDRDCAAVTSAELKRRVWVRLEDAGLAELHPRDLLGMAGLTALFLDGNGFSQLPDGLLSGSPALRLLRLRGNRFEALPTLQGLPELVQLDMGGNLLRELPSAPFADSPNLGYLHLDGNSIEELPADLIAGLENLRLLELQDNSVGALPDGFFDGVNRLSQLKLQDNAGAPFTVSVELAVVDAEDGEDAETAASIRLSVPQGAPFDMAVPLTVAGGTIAAETATIAAGQTMGAPVEVSQGDDAGAVTVSIGGAPAFPPARCGDSDSDLCFTGIQLEVGGAVTLYAEPAAIIVPTLRR